MSDFRNIKSTFTNNKTLSFTDKGIMLHFLFKASHKDFKLRSGTQLKRTQFVTSIRDLESELSLSYQSTRTLLKRLEKLNEIKVISSKEGTIIEVLKYNDYIYTPENKNLAIEVVESKQDIKQPIEKIEEKPIEKTEKELLLERFRVAFIKGLEDEEGSNKGKIKFYNACIKPDGKQYTFETHPWFKEYNTFKELKMRWHLAGEKFSNH
jgi:hypothetical protein